MSDNTSDIVERLTHEIIEWNGNTFMTGLFSRCIAEIGLGRKWHEKAHRFLEERNAYKARAERAEAIVTEIVAAIPLKDTLAASQTGATLVEYVKQAMQKAAQS